MYQAIRLIIRSLFVFVALLFLLQTCTNKSKNIVLSKSENKKNLIKANKGLVGIDQDRITSYAKRRGWEMQVTETGLWYDIFEKGEGEQAKQGKIAHLSYQVSLLDGRVCYSSDSLGIMSFKIGSGGVESGLEEAVLMMRVGSKGRFIMSPHLAYGLLGDENKIPLRSTIVYQAELLKLTDF